MDIQTYSAGYLDFHNHSTYSDGGDTPAKLVERAKRHGVTAIALTDHHTDGGLDEFLSACKSSGILGIPFGTEISLELPQNILTVEDNAAPDFTILGRNPKRDPMKDYQKTYMNYVGQTFLPETLSKLESMGFEIPPVDLDEQVASFSCPPEIFHSFVYHKDNLNKLYEFVSSIDPEVSQSQINDRPIGYLNKHVWRVGGPAYVQRFAGFDLEDALSLTEALNCKLFIAHPGGDFGYLSDQILDYVIQNGVHGIEVRNYFNSLEQNQKFDELAQRQNLLRSGGSDCHGDKGPFKIGIHDRPDNQLPKEILEELWEGLPA